MKYRTEGKMFEYICYGTKTVDLTVSFSPIQSKRNVIWFGFFSIKKEIWFRLASEIAIMKWSNNYMKNKIQKLIHWGRSENLLKKKINIFNWKSCKGINRIQSE